MNRLIALLIFLILFEGCLANNDKKDRNSSNTKTTEALDNKDNELKVGAERLELYLHKIKDKRVGVVANHASLIDNTHLVDVLLSRGVEITKIFSPEHGFRGTADAGEKVKSNVDERTGIAIVSLYGDNKMPSTEQLQKVDILLFDLQDVGCRFYTYISTLHYILKAASINNVEVIVLDRPNPNRNYIDGPVLELEFSSFVGLHPVPVVYGLTIGEYAKMILGENWIKEKNLPKLSVIPLNNYDPKVKYKLPKAPSPNLPNMRSIYLYPSLCLFEGTKVSVGRGTPFPFQHFGNPNFKEYYDYTFIPKPTNGAKSPKLKGEICYGKDLRERENTNESFNGLRLEYLIETFEYYPNKENFFNSFFNLLAGNSTLQKQIKAGLSESEIKASWQEDLDHYLNIREKYLIYGD